MSETRFKVGDRVQYRYGLRQYRAATVSRVGARKVELDDGTAWSALSGYEWGSDRGRGSWDAPYLMEYSESRADESRRQKLVDDLRHFNWTLLTLDQAEQAWRLVGSFVQKEEA